MRIAVCIACGLLAVLPTGRTQAQAKLAGKQTCSTPDQSYSALVGDRAHYYMSLIAQKGTWSQGEIGGDRLTDETDTITSDVSGNVSHDRGYGVGSLASGEGTCTGTFSADGTSSWDIQGEYAIP